MHDSQCLEMVVDRQPVGYDQRARFHIVNDRRLGALPVYGRHAPEADPPELLPGFAFHGDKNSRLTFRTAPPRTFLRSSNKCLIDLNPAKQAFAVSANHDTSKFMQPAPRCLVAAKPVCVA